MLNELLELRSRIEATPSKSLLAYANGNLSNDLLRLIDDGCWWIFPMMTDRPSAGTPAEELYGVPIDALSIREAPLLVAHQGGAATLTSRVRLLVPYGLARQMIAYPIPMRKEFNELRESYFAFWAAFADGQPDLHLWNHALNDEEIVPLKPVPRSQQKQQLLRLLAAIDPLPETQHFVAAALQVLQGGHAPAGRDYGVWRFSMPNIRRPFPTLSEACGTLVGPGARDLEVAVLYGYGGIGTATWNRWINIITVIENDLPDLPLPLPPGRTRDAVMQAIHRMVADQRATYTHNGLGFLNAAGVADEEGEVELAWNLLITASFWARTYAGKCPSSLFATAVWFARKRSLPCAEVLEFMWGIYCDAHPEVDRKAAKGWK